MSDSSEFVVTDASGKPATVRFAPVEGAVVMWGPTWWKADEVTARLILLDWATACDRAARQQRRHQ